MRIRGVLILIMGILLFSSCFAQDTALLDKFISGFCDILEKDSFIEFSSLIKEGARLDDQIPDRVNLEGLFSELKDVHKENDYEKVYKEEISRQKKFIANGEFYLGGHKFGHLTLKLQNSGEGWLVVSIDHCR